MQYPPEGRSAGHGDLVAGEFSPLDIPAELRQNSGRQFRMPGSFRLSPACPKEILYASSAHLRFVVAQPVAVRICRGPGDAPVCTLHAGFRPAEISGRGVGKNELAGVQGEPDVSGGVQRERADGAPEKRRHVRDDHHVLAGRRSHSGDALLLRGQPADDANGNSLAGNKTPDEGHMVSISLIMPDNNHLTQVWTFDDHGKLMADTFTFTRKK